MNLGHTLYSLMKRNIIKHIGVANVHYTISKESSKKLKLYLTD